MLFIITILLAVTVFLAITKTNNKYSLVFTEALLSIVFMIAVSVIYVNSRITYEYLFSFEIHLLRLISKVSISVFSFKTWIYLPLTLYMASMLQLFNIVKYKKMFRYRDIFIYVILIINLLTTNQSVSETLYINYELAATENYSELCKFLYSFINAINVSMVFVFCVLPILAIFLKYRLSKSYYLKRQLLSISTVALVLDIFTIAFLFSGPIKDFFIDNAITDIYSMNTIAMENTYYVILSIYTALILILTIYISVKFKIFDEVSFFKERLTKKNLKLNLDDIKNVFHSMKNAVLLLKLCNKEAKQSISDQEKLLEIFDEQETHINSLISHVTKFLNSYKKENLSLKLHSVTSVINNALSHISPVYDVEIQKDFLCDDAMIYGDSQMLCDAFVNVLQNACEAMENTAAPMLIITIWREDGFACISICDNGCGLNKKQLKKIFIPLFSTKKSFENWGLGLSHTKKVINSHLGFIDVHSTEGIGTTVQIILPEEEMEV